MEGPALPSHPLFSLFHSLPPFPTFSCIAPFPFCSPLQFSSLPLKVGLLKSSRGLGDRREPPAGSGADSETQPKSKLVHFLQNMRSSGNNFNYFPENQLTKLASLVQFECVQYVLSVGLGGTEPSALFPCLRHWHHEHCK